MYGVPLVLTKPMMEEMELLTKILCAPCFSAPFSPLVLPAAAVLTLVVLLVQRRAVEESSCRPELSSARSLPLYTCGRRGVLPQADVKVRQARRRKVLKLVQLTTIMCPGLEPTDAAAKHVVSSSQQTLWKTGLFLSLLQA